MPASSNQDTRPASHGAHHRRRRRHRLLLWLPVAVVVAILAGAAAVAIRVHTQPLPPVSARVLLGPTVRLAGTPAPLAWPSAGEAALATSAGKLIGSSGPAATVPIASVTKVMTAYLVLSDHPLASGQGGPTLTITAAEAAELPARLAAGQSLLGVHAGETFDEYQALQAVLLASADNMAAVLASFDAGTKAAFVAKMNATAARLGLAHTHFTDPSGFDAGSVSDPADLLALGRAAMAIPTFAAIVAQRSATIPGVTSFPNYNALVGTDGFTGIKTGSTVAAGQALLFSVTRSVANVPVSIFGVVLRQHGSGVVTAALAAAKALADSYYAGLAQRTVLAAGTPVVALSRAGQKATLVTTGPLALVAPAGAVVGVGVVTGGVQQSGDPGGRVTVSTALGRAVVALRGPLPPPPTLGWRLRHILA